MEKMVEGRLRKYFEEVVLLEQKYVVNDSTNIKSVLNDLSKEVGSKGLMRFLGLKLRLGLHSLQAGMERM
ncbi:hypothetical protein E2562_017575 [Oryza meyeriana var. granulata]|nr:hypothetical protein E2562_017575 [Oryza meyeriana var. granulata]